MMDPHIKNALTACIEQYQANDLAANGSLLIGLIKIFDGDSSFMDKIGQMDELLDNHTEYEELREYIFDLLLMNFFSADVGKLENDYLESEEWERIEENTIERGSELLNVLLYLMECIDEDIQPELDDFLKEFLLVDEDEFQDEHRIYEPVISQAILVESSYAEIAGAARKLDHNQELAELFYPMLSYFYEQEPSDSDLEEFVSHAPNPKLDLAIYQLITNYNR